mmetsp:Transcript_29321/g.62860  ORF Transcript_29321/g.62860 Transcript_29321/m.62860 type:complete len:218 (+) Transcript_29321:1076-1729(+)
MYLGVALNFLYPLMTLLTLSRKSFSETDLRRARIENMPASVQTLWSSAPVVFGQRRAMSSKRMSRSQFIRLEWIFRMWPRPSRSGRPNSTFRSSRPGRMSAGSRVSGRLVAISTLMFPRASNPSSSVTICSIVLWTSLSLPLSSPPPPRAPPMASTSSKNTMQARFDRAIVKSSRTIRAPSPTYFWTSSEPMTRMKQASVRLATARAVSVFPVPGGP